MKSRVLVLVMGITLLGASCGPKIRSFVLAPRNVCAGAETKVTWDVRGDASLQVSYARADKDATDEPDTVTLLLVARRGRDSVTQLEDVLQFPARFTHTMAIATTLEGNEVVARGETNPALWPTHFVIETVESGSGRPVTARHGGRTAVLAVNGPPSDGLRGIPLAGAWELRSGVAPGETPPDRLRAVATVACNP